MTLSFDLDAALKILRQPDIEGLSWLRNVVNAHADPEDLARLGQAMPGALGPINAELSLVMSAIAASLAPYGLRMADDVLRLTPVLRGHWLRAYLPAGFDPSRLDDRTLAQTLAGKHPPLAALFPRLVTAEDERLRFHALDAMAAAVQNLVLSGHEAFRFLRTLADDEVLAIRQRAVRLLWQPWLIELSHADKKHRETILSKALQDPASVKEASEATLRLGYADLIRDAAWNRATPPLCRAPLMAALGAYATLDDLNEVMKRAREAPLALGSVARRMILDAHRHGVFLKEEHLEGLLALFDSHQGWTAEEFVRVSYIARNALPALLAKVEPDDERWQRRAALLAWSNTPMSPLLSRLLAKVSDERNAVEFVRAAGSRADFLDEDTLLSWLGRLPENTLPILRVKGGPKTVARLRTMVMDPATVSNLRAQAFEVLWSLSEDRTELLSSFAAAVGDKEANLWHWMQQPNRNPEIALLVAEHATSNDDGGPSDMQVLKGLCAVGHPRLRPFIRARFRALVLDCVGRAIRGDFSAKRIMLPELEQMLYAHGRQLAVEQRPVRSWIEDTPETGRDFLLSVMLEWLDTSPPDPVKVALLEMIGRHQPSGPTLQRILPFWRSKNKGVQRAAIEAILGSGEGARGLELSLCRLAQSDDARLVCQALAAVASLKAHWAEPLVIPLLDRPEMSVKKAAADALSQIGSSMAAPAIVGWLARHDNTGFRRSLLSALNVCAGASATIVLIRALENPADSDHRRFTLLGNALDRKLTTTLVLALAGSVSSTHAQLVEAYLRGDIVPCGKANVERVRRALHRSGPVGTKEEQDITAEILRDGFSNDAAKRLLQALKKGEPRKQDELLSRVIAASFAEWAQWLGEQKSPDPWVLNTLFHTVTQTQDAQIDILLQISARNHVDAARWIDFALRFRKRFTEIQRLEAIRQLRAFANDPGAGLRRFELLKALGAVRTADDLLAALAAMVRAPDYVKQSGRLLIQALAIPSKTKDEPFEITVKREQALAWAETDPSQRESWLLSILDESPVDIGRLPEATIRTQPADGRPKTKLVHLLARLRSGQEDERSTAALELLRWPDAEAYNEIRELFLTGKLDLNHEARGRLALSLRRWPFEETEAKKAMVLLPYFRPFQIRGFIPTWLEQWREGRLDLKNIADERTRSLLFEAVASAVRSGDHSVVRLLSLGRDSLAFAQLRTWLEETAPSAAALIHEEPKVAESEAEPLQDPLEGLDLAGLSKFVLDRKAATDLSVRAVHALISLGESASGILATLATDRRARVRTAALRGLRRVGSKQASARATLDALQMESRKDQELRLMKSLASVRFEPALTALFKRLVSGDRQTRQGAYEALRLWGRSATTAIKRARKKARPDHRAIFSALLLELESSD